MVLPWNYLVWHLKFQGSVPFTESAGFRIFPQKLHIYGFTMELSCVTFQLSGSVPFTESAGFWIFYEFSMHYLV